MKRTSHLEKSSFLSASNATSSLLSDLNLEKLLRPHMAKVYWAETVGPQIAAATQVVSVKNGILTVRAKDCVWANELVFLVDDIAQKLNAVLKGPFIQKIRIDSSGLTAPARPSATPPPHYATDEELEAVELSDDSLSRIELSLYKVDDEELRDCLRRTLLRVARTSEWKRQHLWSPCTECGVLVAPPNNICPLCRLGIL